MKAAGVVVEYNPFHNGHLHHLLESKNATGADLVIAIMSGNFLQRGEPALVDKWTRARMALEAGVDLVVELPYSFATQHAEVFAYGAISLLNALRCESFCFGSESGNISAFETTADQISRYRDQYDLKVQDYIKQGMSYPSALSSAYQELNLSNHLIDLSQPNNILGFHYIEARNKIESSMKAFTISRKNAGYHDQSFTSSNVASATSIRKSIFSEDGGLSKISPFVPSTTLKALQAYRKRYGDLHGWEMYWPLLKYRLLSSTAEELRVIYEIEEGIENRLKNCAKTSFSFYEYMEKVKTKRYTWTRIQRMSLHILTNTTKQAMMDRHTEPKYIRLLGMSSIGTRYLNKIKKEITLPIVSTISKGNPSDTFLDRKASEIYSLGHIEPEKQADLYRKEYATPPIIVSR
ncbi:putative nucleotidyltransferase [Bacillus pakistanensis]|uniref:tRNA(Met) cytidine acetate ligase n=1 Tax=Rossellomorea pakistanensis TaxID=992288 RepID=A0ABS2NFU8_9BACI|nr:nucleotidyltransferase [Bacillus pakistanensis]MBM7586719.1 putative nucleotidyltransferase [Bacillus pakistanensis]